VREANRILKIGGLLKIVEVRSRFEKEAEGVKKFIRTVKKLGFGDSRNSSGSGNSSNNGNKMFFELECAKVADASDNVGVEYSAGACVYKKR
jgi:ribosomal RNA-processing protein 8